MMSVSQLGDAQGRQAELELQLTALRVENRRLRNLLKMTDGVEPPPDQVLRHFVRGAGPLLARAAPISEVLRAAALTDPKVRTIFDRHDHLQLTGVPPGGGSGCQQGRPQARPHPRNRHRPAPHPVRRQHLRPTHQPTGLDPRPGHRLARRRHTPTPTSLTPAPQHRPPAGTTGKATCTGMCGCAPLS